jgi:hypothetical protein
VTGWTFHYVWHELPYRVAIRFVNWLPNHWYRVNASAARLGFAFETFAGAKHESYPAFLEPWMRPEALRTTAKRAFYPKAVVEGVNLAFDLGFLSQAALVALGPKRLRESGAFAPDRDTSTE